MTVAYSPALEVSDDPATAPDQKAFVPSAGGGPVTLTTLDDIIKSFATSGWLSDFRMSDALYTSSADTSTPVTTDGDLVGRVLNQSTASASTGWYLNEATSKPQWVENYGIASASTWSNNQLDDTPLATGWTILDGMTTVVAARISQDAMDNRTASPFMSDESSSRFTISPRVKSDGTLYIRNTMIGGGVDYSVTADENNIIVVFLQTTSDGQSDASATVDMYCNNTFVAQRPAGSKLNFPFTFSIDQIRSDTPATMQMLGLAQIKGSLSSAQRQNFCDYFQANGGVLS